MTDSMYDRLLRLDRTARRTAEAARVAAVFDAGDNAAAIANAAIATPLSAILPSAADVYDDITSSTFPAAWTEASAADETSVGDGAWLTQADAGGGVSSYEYTFAPGIAFSDPFAGASDTYSVIVGPIQVRTVPEAGDVTYKFRFDSGSNNYVECDLVFDDTTDTWSANGASNDGGTADTGSSVSLSPLVLPLYVRLMLRKNGLGNLDRVGVTLGYGPTLYNCSQLIYWRTLAYTPGTPTVRLQMTRTATTGAHLLRIGAILPTTEFW